MKASHAGGRKTQNDAARPALGNMLEQHVEATLAAMAKGVVEALTPIPLFDSLDSRCRQIDTAARLGSATAALVSAAARLNGKFHHDIRVQHEHYFNGLPDDAYAPEDEGEEVDDEAPQFTDEELKAFTPDDLMREIPIRKAQYAARQTAERLAAEASAPAWPSTEPPSAPAPAGDEAASERSGGPFARPTSREQSERDEGGPSQTEEGPIARLMNDIEAQIAAAEEDDFSEEDLNEDGLDEEED